MSDISKFRKYFLTCIAIIAIFGIVMVYSSSYIWAKEVFGTPNHFFTRQVLFTLLGVLITYIVSKTRINFWYRWSSVLNFLAIILLILTLVPGVGISIKGANRWLNFVFFSFQPSEIVKYTLMLHSFYVFENYQSFSTQKKVISSTFLCLPLIIFITQPDFGSFSICLSVMAFVCFLSSFPRKWFYSLISIGFASALGLIFTAPYRFARFKTFLDPWKDPQNSGFQIIQSYLAFANGFVFGQGIGNSHEKLFYLPEAHNDFIFSVVGEELGFLGVLSLAIAFVCLIYWGMKIAVNLKNKINVVLVASIVFTIGFQAVLNMSVVLGLLPTKGLNLPFISYGGSSLICNFFALGILLSASYEKMTDPVSKREDPLTAFRDANVPPRYGSFQNPNPSIRTGRFPD